MYIYMYLFYFKYLVIYLDDFYIWVINFYRLVDNDIVFIIYFFVGKEVGIVNVDVNVSVKDDEKNMEEK